MDLTQLQAELRAVENKMSELQAEIEKMKPRPQADLAADYAKIARSAKQAPVNNLLVSAADDYTKKSYLSGLAYLSFAGQPVDMDRLLYLTALSFGIGCGYEPENLVTLGMRMDENAFEYVSEAVRPYRISFMTDAFVIANMTGTAETSMLEALTGMTYILGCTADDMKVIAAVAKAVLTEDFDVLDSVPPEQACKYSGQFKGHIPESWLEKRRVVHLEDKSIAVALFRSKKNEQVATVGAFVHKGDVLLSYDYEDKFPNIANVVIRAAALAAKKTDTTQHYSLKSKSEGYFYIIERGWSVKNASGENVTNNERYYYVISPFDDLASLEKWHDAKHSSTAEKSDADAPDMGSNMDDLFSNFFS